jgi:hypothetical protein
MKHDHLPQVAGVEDRWRVHQTDGLYFLNVGGVAHPDSSCNALDGVELVQNPRWRVATAPQCREVGANWCTNCA